MAQVQSDTGVGNLQIILDERYRNKWTLWRVTEVFHLSTNIRATSTVKRTREPVAVGRKLVERLDQQSFTWRSREVWIEAQFYFNGIFKLTNFQMQRGLWDDKCVNSRFIMPARWGLLLIRWLRLHIYAGTAWRRQVLTAETYSRLSR